MMLGGVAGRKTPLITLNSVFLARLTAFSNSTTLRKHRNSEVVVFGHVVSHHSQRVSLTRVRIITKFSSLKDNLRHLDPAVNRKYIRLTWPNGRPRLFFQTAIEPSRCTQSPSKLPPCPPRSRKPSMSTPNYGPNESAYDIFLERTFLAGDLITGVGYGIQVVLYTSCVTFLYSQYSRSRRSISSSLLNGDTRALFLLLYITLLFSIETIYTAVQARTVQIMYIDNRNYPGGPWAYFLATQNLPVNVMFYATLFVLTFLSDLLVLWRCWVIWTASGRLIACIVVAFPAILLLASFVMGTLWTLQSSQPGLSLYSALPMAYGTSYYIISLSVNIILTILITVRLLLYRRRARMAIQGDHGSEYISLATIMIESAALYSVFALIFIVTYAINNPLNQIFLGVASSAQQIAGYLIIYRVAQGRAWNSTTASTANPTSLHFGVSSHGRNSYARPVSQNIRQSDVMVVEDPPPPMAMTYKQDLGHI